MANIQGCFSSKNNEWATPTAFFRELDAEFNFDLDPCCTDANAKCKRHYTKQDNGLTKDWGGAEYFVIHRTVGIYQYGLRNAMRKAVNLIRWWLCLYQLERIPRISTTIYTTGLRLGLSEAGCILTTLKRVPRFRLWL